MIVLWRVTTACNLACGFCAYDRRLHEPRRQADPAEVERVAALFAAFGRACGEDVLVSWLGGEPLLWRGVLPLSRRLREAHGLRISATTNGTTLGRPGELDAIVAAFDELTVSIDALAATHDRLRGRPGGWAATARAVRELVARRGVRRSPKLRANVVLMRDTLPDFASLCDRLADWGLDEITVNQLGGRDRPEFHATQALRPDDIAALQAAAPALVARLAARGVKLCLAPRYLERFAATADGRALSVDDCDARRPTLFVDEYGRIGACSFTVDTHAVAIGDLRTVEDVARLRGRLLAARRDAPPAVCRDCPSTQVFAKFGT